MQHKICLGCGESKPITEYHKQILGRYHVTSRCKACIKAQRALNRDKYKAYNKAYYQRKKAEYNEKNM